MHITAIEEYGLRCALQLANLSKTGPVSASVIADNEGISVEYASKIMHLFRKAGLVKAIRGIQGGFQFIEEPQAVSLRDIFAALRSDKQGVDFCTKFTGLKQECVHFQDCSVRPVWQKLNSYFDQFISSLTLADLLNGETEARKQIQFCSQAQTVKQ